jgi:hypothetical protein
VWRAGSGDGATTPGDIATELGMTTSNVAAAALLQLTAQGSALVTSKRSDRDTCLRRVSERA